MKNRKAGWLKMLFVSVLLTCTALTAMAQNKSISGVVKDANGETIISASVMVKGTTIGTVTDFDGNFKLDVPANAQTLVVSYIGMQTQELPIKGSTFNIILKEDNKVLDEVVVTGYGTTKKRDLVTSVASVGGDQLKDVPVSTAAEALEGKLAGVSVTTTEGSPDADIKIRVRGGTSLTQSNDPLYIVDGFPVSSISDIAPSDIASMDVLKDAAATAIYGAQGANGVIVITTKELKSDSDKMKFSVNYTGYMGWKKVASKYDMMDVKNFILMQKEWAHLNKNDQMDNYFWKYFDPHYDVEASEHTSSLNYCLDYWSARGKDWQDETFGRTGLNSNHSFTVNGGNKNAQFMFTYNRIDDEGIMYGSDYDRNNFSFKSKFTPVKNLTLGVTARYTNTKVVGSGTNTAEDAGSKSESRVRNAVAYAPIEGIASNLSYDLGGDEESFGSIYDPITTIDDNYRVKTDNKWSLNGYVQYKFLKHFTARADLSYEARDITQNRYYGPTTYYSRSSVSAYTSTGLGNAITTDQKTSRLKHTGSLDYKQTFNSDHNVGIFVAEEVQVNKGQTFTMNSYGFDKTMDGATVFDHLGSAENYVTTTYVNPNDNLLSFIGRADYNYKSKYYATLTFRADCSTKFSQGHQWGYFPSGALAWNLAEEDWLQNVDWLSQLKLRATYGLVGNNNIELGYIHPEYLAYAASASGLNSTQYYMGGTSIIAANENLKWETTTSRNLGLDFGFLNQRLSGSLDVYCNTTNDLLLLYRLPDGGYNYQYRNIGATRNIGEELSLTGVILDKKSKALNYNLTVTANIAHNNTIVKSLGGMSEYNVSSGCFSANYDNMDYEYKLVEGGRVGDIYGYQVDGFYTANDFNGYTTTTSSDLTGGQWTKDGKVISTPMGNAMPGMAKIKDVNGDGKIDQNDRTVIGNTQPKFTGGFNISLNVGGEKWGKVDFSSNFTYSIGNKILNLSALDYSTITEKTRLRNVDASLENRYTYMDASNNYIAYTGDFADYQARLNEANVNASEATPITKTIALTDKYVEDGSFLRLSSLTLGYTIPDAALKKCHMSTLRVFFTASNLFCITKYSGADPEVDTRSKSNPLATGVDFSAFPKSRAFNFGLSVGF